MKLDYNTMEGIFTEVARYRNAPGAIGFSCHFFSTRMAESENVKLLAVNGVAPGRESIRDNSYPLQVRRYSATLKDNAKTGRAGFFAVDAGPPRAGNGGKIWLRGELGRSRPALYFCSSERFRFEIVVASNARL